MVRLYRTGRTDDILMCFSPDKKSVRSATGVMLLIVTLGHQYPAMLEQDEQISCQSLIQLLLPPLVQVT